MITADRLPRDWAWSSATGMMRSTSSSGSRGATESNLLRSAGLRGRASAGPAAQFLQQGRQQAAAGRVVAAPVALLTFAAAGSAGRLWGGQGSPLPVQEQ